MQNKVAGFFNFVKQEVPQSLSEWGLQSKCHQIASSCFSNLSGKLLFQKKSIIFLQVLPPELNSA